MKTAVQKWGNSLALRIPKAFAAQAKIEKGSPVNLALEKGRLVVSPLGNSRISLKKLLAKITPENIHPESDWGPPAGKEVW